MKIIEDGLIREKDHWTATYPWIRDPTRLTNNHAVGFAMLKSTERRLLQEKIHTDRYM